MGGARRGATSPSPAVAGAVSQAVSAVLQVAPQGQAGSRGIKTTTPHGQHLVSDPRRGLGVCVFGCSGCFITHVSPLARHDQFPYAVALETETGL